MERKNKATVGLLLLSIMYMIFCCLIFFSLTLIVVKFVISHEVNIKQSDLENILVASVIVGTAAAFRSWIFTKLDERKTRKTPSSGSWVIRTLGNNVLAGAAGAATGEVVGMIATEMCGISPGTVTCKRYITKLHPSLYERIYISFADKIEINSANEEE